MVAHAASARVSIHDVDVAVSGSPNDRSRLGMPPRARTGTIAPGRTRNSAARRCGEATRPPAAGACASRRPRTKTRGGDRTGGPADHEITAAGQRRCARLLKHHFAHAKQRGHH